MTKDAIIADLRETCQELRAENRRLLEMLQVALDSQHAQRARWRDQKRQQRRSPVECPQECPADSPVDMGGNLIGGGATVPPVLGETINPEVGGTVEDKNQGESAERGSGGQSADKDADWLAFKTAYPRSDRNSWTVAERRFKALSKDDRAAALEAAPRYAARVKPEYIKGAQSWIKERRWETVDDAPTVADSGSKEPLGITALRAWRQQQDAEEACIEGEVVRR